MWPDRKRFIKTYFNKGHINDAWFILGRKAYKERNKFLPNDLENSYGIIAQGGNSDHSVLLLRIGDIILTEWSYNGKVRGWHSNFTTTPEFYKKKYTAKELRFEQINRERGQIISIVHHPRSWMHRLSKEIYKYTDIDLSNEFD